MTEQQRDPLELMTADQVADLFQMSRIWVYRQAESGVLPSVKLGAKALRFRRRDVEAYLESKAA